MRRSSVTFVGLVLAAGLGLLPTRSAGEDGKRARRSARSYTVSEYVYRKIESVRKLMSAEHYAEADKILTTLAARRGLSGHEKAVVYQTHGYLESSRGDYRKAAADFERCLAEKALPDAAQRDAQYNLAQLYIGNEQYERAVTILKNWFSQVTAPRPAAYYLLAVAYVRQGKMDRALPPARRAVQSVAEPRESWMRLLLAVELAQKRYQAAAALLESLVSRFAKKTYWIQLAEVYSQLGRDDRTLAVMQLAYAQGFLDRDTELRNLARMYLIRQIPYRAARLLERGLTDGAIEEDSEAWRLLADSWLNAREYEHAIEPLRRAAALSSDGEGGLRLSRVYAQLELWDDAAAAVREALDKGGLKHPGKAWLLLGIAEHAGGRSQAARRAFAKAREYPATRTSAREWLVHLDQEAQSAGARVE